MKNALQTNTLSDGWTGLSFHDGASFAVNSLVLDLESLVSNLKAVHVLNGGIRCSNLVI